MTKASTLGIPMTISRDDIANGIVEGRRLRAQAVRNTLGRVRTYFSDPRP